MDAKKEDQIAVIAYLLRCIDLTEQMVEKHGIEDSMGKQYAYRKMKLTKKLEKRLNEFGLKTTILTDLKKPEKKDFNKNV
ncbi:MAG: hypothetical protein R3E32_12165 [Chitinophagales bacterium]